LLHGRGEGIVQRLFRGLEPSEEADQRSQYGSGLRAIDPVYGSLKTGFGRHWCGDLSVCDA
jgi:hypothetical protein